MQSGRGQDRRVVILSDWSSVEAEMVRQSTIAQLALCLGLLASGGCGVIPSDSTGPIGGGLASGTGVNADLACPPGVPEEQTEWFGPVGHTMEGAVAEGFGDLVVGWIGEPFEIESTDSWSSWGLHDEGGNLVAVVTLVASTTGWDPSHADYCVIHRPTPPPPPLTLYVSNQSFEDANVHIIITVDEIVVVDQNFAVEGQHNWITFEPDLGPGEHTLTATSNTGAELTVEFSTEVGQPRWAVVDYWWYPEEGPRAFTFGISDEPLAFG
jgi:hypothetical protein